MTDRAIKTIGIVGGGAWGTALACVAARGGREVCLWAREPEVVDSINQSQENKMFLPGVTLPAGVAATGDLATMASAGAVLLVAPAQATRAVSTSLAPHISKGVPIIICAKGIEQESGKFLSEVLGETIPHASCMVLSGPSFAADVARGLPTAVTLAARTLEMARPVADALAIPSFRPYLSSDITGAQVGGAVKNVLAIASGIVDGKGFGESARAATTARAFAELQRFGAAMGARPETLGGLSGLGDLILTCSSTQSRNMSLGAALGKGRSMDDVMAERNSVSEGVHTASILAVLAESHGIEMPISAAVNAIVSGNAGVGETIENLLNRPIRAE
jgi:glycerol-3-phosphate dehydrogenase (NAD(P)+)